MFELDDVDVRMSSGLVGVRPRLLAEWFSFGCCAGSGRRYSADTCLKRIVCAFQAYMYLVFDLLSFCGVERRTQQRRGGCRSKGKAGR